jgi:hypothetical protein
MGLFDDLLEEKGSGLFDDLLAERPPTVSDVRKTEPIEPAVQRGRRGGTRSEARPYAGGGALTPGPGESVLDEPADPSLLRAEPGFTPQEMAEGSMAPSVLAGKRAFDAASIRRGNAPSARAPNISENIAWDLREATQNPVARGAASGFSQLGKTGVGAVRLLSDFVGADSVSDFAAGASRSASTVAQGSVTDLGGNDKIVANVTSSIVNTLPAMAMGVIGGPAFTTMFAQSALAEYNEGRDAGFGVGESLARANIMGFAEVLGERFGGFGGQVAILKGLAKGMPKGELAQAVGAILKRELPGEELTTLVQFVADKVGPAALKPDATFGDYLEAAADTAVTTIGQTLVMGGGPAAAIQLRREFRKADGIPELVRQPIVSPLQAARDRGFLSGSPASPAVPVIRVEDMPSRPLTAEEVASIRPAAPAKPPVAESVAAGEQQAPSTPVTPAAPAPTLVPDSAKPAVTQPAPSAALPAIAQGSLAGTADQLLRNRVAAQPMAVDSGPAVGQPVGGAAPAGALGQQPGGAVDQAPGRSAVPGPGSVRSAELADPASTSALTADGFRTAGEALAWSAQEGIAGRVSVAQSGRGFALQPQPVAPSAKTLQEDARELDSLNRAVSGWKQSDGSPVAVRVVPDQQVAPGYQALRSAVESAFGIRVVPVTGLPNDGVQYGRRAYVDVTKSRANETLIGVTGHEAFHWLEVNDPGAAKSMYEGLAPLLRPRAVGRQLRFENENLTSGETPMTEAGARSEVVANINGAMWVDSKFWGRMYDLDNGSTFRKVLYAFMRAATKLAKVAPGGQFDPRRYVTDVNAAREVAAQVWAQRAQAKGKTAAPLERGPVQQSRRTGESDKEFAKRVIDVRPRPKTLVEAHELYFTRPAGTITVPIAKLQSTKTNDENQQGGENAVKRMEAAARGELAKRPPVTVMPSASDDGVYEVVDGNGTVASVKGYRWKALPVTVVSREEGLRAIRGERARKAAQAGRPQINGRDYDYGKAGDNFRSPAVSALFPSDLIARADRFIADLSRQAAPVELSPEDRAKAEAMLEPMLAAAAEAKNDYDQKIIDVARKSGAIGQMLAPIKSMKRAAEKLVLEEKWDASAIKDTLRSTIVVASYNDAQKVVDGIVDSFDVVRIKERAERPELKGPKTTHEPRAKFGGYADVLVNVRTPNGVIAEIQINIPAMLAAKEGQGHKLYEIQRNEPKGSPLRAQVAQAMGELYDFAFSLDAHFRDAAAVAIKPSSDIGAPRIGSAPTSRSSSPSSDALNTLSSGNRTNSSPENEATNSQPGGNESGNFTSSTSLPGTPPGTPIVSDVGAYTVRQAKRLKPGERFHNEPVDPSIAADIGKQLKLTKAEIASTSLGYATGKPKEKAFAIDAVGKLPATVQFLEDRRRASGLRPLNIELEADRKVLAKLMAAETLAGIRSAGNALEWYDSTINRTLAAASLKYPELASDRNARNAFVVAMAVSSQGLNVENNLTFAMTQYAAFRGSSPDPDARRFPETGEGESAGAMAKNFTLANDLLADLGPDLFRRFLRTPFTVGELNGAGFSADSELMDEMVLGSSVFGPKVGFGFYSNLSGNFEPVTMDMWFMRTIGRLTGFLRAFDADRFGNQLAGFRKALDERGTNGVYADAFDADVVQRAKEDEGSAVELARAVLKAHEKDYKANRDQFDSGQRVKTKMVNAAATIVQSMDKPRDVPASGGERRLLRDVVRRAVALVEKAHGQRVPPASLQALIWYPEQELYKALGVSLNVTSQDYAGAIEKILEGEGYAKADISAAQSGPGSARRVAGQAVAAADQADGQENRGSDALQGREREEFLADRTRRESLRREQLNPRRTRLNFEVAPDPNNADLVARWRALSLVERARISRVVMERIVPSVLQANDNTGLIVEQTGSYLEDTNPSFQVMLDKHGSALAIAKELGFVLSQDSMMLIGPKAFKGSFEAGAVVVNVGGIGEAQIDALYKRLREVRLPDGSQISGQSTSNGQMTVMVPAGFQQDWGRAVAAELGSTYTVKGAVVHAAFPEKTEYDYGVPDDDPRGSAGLARRRARDLRSEASRILESELSAVGPRQSRSGLGEPSVRSGDRGGESAREEPGVVRGAVHYGRAQGLTSLSGQAYGSGLRGAERSRLEISDDPRIKRRVYFYVPKLDGSMPLRESGVGAYRYEADLTNLADFDLSPAHSKRVRDARKEPGPNGLESAVLDAGFDGYISRSNGMAVVLDRDVPVRQSRSEYASRDTTRARGYNPAAVAAGDYTGLEGKIVEQKINLADGREAILRVDAARAMRRMDERISAMEMLRKCVRGAA